MSLSHYIDYHKNILSFKDKLFVADFEKFTKNLPEVIKDINTFFNMTFSVPSSHEDAQNSVFAGIDDKNKRATGKIDSSTSHRPNAKREQQAEQIKPLLFQEHHARKREHALSLYRMFKQ